MSTAALALACVLPIAGCSDAQGEPAIPDAPAPIEPLDFEIVHEAEPTCGRYVGNIAFFRGRPTNRDVNRYVTNITEQLHHVSQIEADGGEITGDMSRANMLRTTSWLDRIVINPETYTSFINDIVEHAEEMRAKGPVRIDIYGVTGRRSRSEVATNRAVLVQQTLEIYLGYHNRGRPIDEMIEPEHIHSFPITNSELLGESNEDNYRTLVFIRNLTESEQDGYEAHAMDLDNDRQLQEALAEFTPGNWLCMDDASAVVAEYSDGEVIHSGEDRSYRISIIRTILRNVDDVPTREHLRRLHAASTEQLISLAERVDPNFRPHEGATGLPMPAGTLIEDEFDGEIDSNVAATIARLARTTHTHRRRSYRSDRDRHPRRPVATTGGAINASSIAKTNAQPRDSAKRSPSHPEPAQAKLASFARTTDRVAGVQPVASATDEAAPRHVRGLSQALGLTTPPPAVPPTEAVEPTKAPHSPTMPVLTKTAPEHSPTGPVKLAVVRKTTGGFRYDNPFDDAEGPNIGQMIDQIDTFYARIIRELDEGFNLDPEGNQIYDPDTQSDHIAVGACINDVIEDLTILQESIGTVSTVLHEGPAAVSSDDLQTVYDVIERLSSPDGSRCVRRYADLRHSVYELNDLVEQAELQVGLMCAVEDVPTECEQYRERLNLYSQTRLEQLGRATGAYDTFGQGRVHIRIPELPPRPESATEARQEI